MDKSMEAAAQVVVASGEPAGSVLGADAAAQEPVAAGGGRHRDEELLRVHLRRGRRRAGPATPSPSWKLEGSPPTDAAATQEAAPVVAARRSSAVASARQLGASLWEIHDVMRAGRHRRSGRGLVAGDAEPDQPQSSGDFGRHVAGSLIEHHKLHEERNHALQPFSPASYTSSIGDATANRAISPTRSLNIKGRTRGASYSIKTSTELLKVLNRIWSLEEQQAASLSVVNGLKLELQQAQARIQELMQERRAYRHEVASLMRQVSEDKLVRKTKVQEKNRAALHSLQDVLENERRLRKHSEGLHRKLGKELSEIKSAFLKAVKDLEKEKKANCLLEDLCDEFAKGIRNYEEEVRVLKQRHAKNYEHKFDKSVLHISEAWLDERMQMQNLDAKGDLAQKTTITERLSSEIQAFLLSKRSVSSKNDAKQDASLRRQSLESVHLNGATSAPQLAEDEDDDSVASDLHCFELSMHGDGIQNHAHAAPRKSGLGSKDESRRRFQYSHGAAAEGSDMSHVQICSQKDKPRSSSSKHIPRTPEINSYNNAEITPAEDQNEIASTHISQGFHDSSLNNILEAHAACLGQESLDHYSRTSQFCEGTTTSGDLCNARSPARQLNYQCAPLDHEISECSPKLPPDVKENTLKAKLLQARLEGRHAWLKAPGVSLTSSRRK